MPPKFTPTFRVTVAPPAGPRPAEVPGLVYLGDPQLAQPSAPVDAARIGTPEFAARLATLHWALIEAQGLGIAAPQIGWAERFFLLVHSSPREAEASGEAAPVSCWINPRIVEASTAQAWCWEGCLSVPGLRGWVRRPAAVLVRGLDERGRPVERELTGWEARAWQHEYDHLDGMLFPYRVRDPRHLATVEALAGRADWPADWPAPGARDLPFGEVLPE